MRDTFSICSVARERKMLADRVLLQFQFISGNSTFCTRHKILAFIVGQCKARRGASFAANFDSFRTLFPSSA